MVRKPTTYEDETRYCENCGISFIWTTEEQRSPNVRVAIDSNPSIITASGTDMLFSEERNEDQDSSPATIAGEATGEATDVSVAGAAAQIGVDGIIDDRNDDVGAAKLSSVRWPSTAQSVDEQSAPAYCPGCRQLLPSPNKERGEVKWYHRRKGYGFITRQGGSDLYVHRSAIQRSKAYGGYLKLGDLVEFALGENRHGSVASKVRILDRSADSP